MAESAVTSKGQITIPAEVRRAKGLQHQDRVVLTVMPDGTTVMRAKTRSLQSSAPQARSSTPRVPRAGDKT
jgi:antitoxin PrlF